MTNWQISTPVALLVFNRPDTTAKVFAEIAKMKPTKLLVVADGPRSDRPGEAEKCDAVRTIVEQINWDCELLTNYSDINLGCKKRVSSGLNWVFNEVEEAIILEDDCFPHPSFFRFCEELLQYYRNDARVMMISGDNFQQGHRRTEYSYYFSRYAHIWGWASWRRAWKFYDVDIKTWPTIRDGGWIKDLFKDNFTATRWIKAFEMLHNRANTWDMQWMFTCWIQNGLVILPNVNLVSNIGFSEDATHTKHVANSSLPNLPISPMEFPLRHPPFMIRDTQADNYTEKNFFAPGFFDLVNLIIAKTKRDCIDFFNSC